ncbi:MAG TPA: M15 family metallopeptidase [Xanthobacteraceae bacterium]|nr:M15 family metallopeptidase [Xanthobacteraceae bacterium]
MSTARTAAVGVGILLLVLWHILGHTLAARAGDAPGGKVAPISPALCDDMKSHNVMKPESPVSCARLKLVTFPYVGFDGQVHGNGEIVVMDAVAEHVLQIFSKLRDIRFPIAKARLMNHYEGNDSASTADDNTSSFNARKAVGSNSFSMHAYGLAIDLNPVQNPFARRAGSTLIFRPPSGIEYANRFNDRPGKNFRGGMAESVIDVFADQGFVIWGGYWDNPIDYQHFEVYPNLAERLAALSPGESQAVFRQYVERYRTCRRNAPQDSPRAKCIRD